MVFRYRPGLWKWNSHQYYTRHKIYQTLLLILTLTPLNQGVHIVGIRSRDANGAWSIDNKWLFLKPYSNTGRTMHQILTGWNGF